MRHVLFAIIGMIGGIVVGYALYALGRTPYSYGFVTWLTDSKIGDPISALIWVVLGAVAGTAASFIPRSKNSN
jgi:uncharacterized membrane protein YeaQ/YmgE (transglycosylase-associated protein family)